MPNTDAELTRVRDKLHDFISVATGRLGQTDVEIGTLIVRVADLEADRDKYVPVIDQLVLANATAVALTEQLRGDRRVKLAWWQIAIAMLALLTPYILFSVALFIGPERL